MPTGAELLAELDERGLLHDCTSREALATRLDDGVTRLYCGFDPTADSLHLGNLQSIMLLRRYQLAGHAPVALVGGATGMIGDPSGRSDERQFLDAEELDANREAIAAQLRSLLDFEPGECSARLVDNRTWTEPMGVLEFLRDVGKYATVNTMLARDSVRSRIEREAGISFTEFSYMLLQAHDFLVLHRDDGCDLQVAGSDQWGNITAGVDLIRRRMSHSVHGMTAPLILRSDGSKFGKSEGDNIWLSARRTSPYRMYQYLLNVPDAEVQGLLLRLTTVPVEECRSVAESHMRQPGLREGQRRLAREITAMVHGPETLAPIERASEILFGGPMADATEDAFILLSSELPTTRIPAAELEGLDPVELFTRSGLGRSKGEVRRNPAGYFINQLPLVERGDGHGRPIGRPDLRHGRFILLRRGKTAHHLVESV
jgi:tyrosyl-tRNA synthetase